MPQTHFKIGVRRVREMTSWVDDIEAVTTMPKVWESDNCCGLSCLGIFAGIVFIIAEFTSLPRVGMQGQGWGVAGIILIILSVLGGYLARAKYVDDPGYYCKPCDAWVRGPQIVVGSVRNARTNLGRTQRVRDAYCPQCKGILKRYALVEEQEREYIISEAVTH